MDLFFNPTEKVIDTIIVELDESQHLFTAYYGRKFGKKLLKSRIELSNVDNPAE